VAGAATQQVPEGSATAKAIDYSLKRWKALTRYIDDGELPIDNNWVENQIRPIALGRSNWLFAGSLRAASERCGGDEPAAVGTAQRAGSVQLSVAKQINGGHYAEAERLIGSGSQFALASNEVATILMRAKRGL
jgi:hypothetical protein